jgi:hypothetical protein
VFLQIETTESDTHSSSDSAQHTKKGDYPMKKIAVLTTILALLVLPLSVRPVLAAPGGPPHLNWGSELNAGECPQGKLVINVTQRVINTMDSGVVNWWAYSDYHRQIQVWQTSPTDFCALVRYQGAFTTTGGPSPNDTDLSVAPGLHGTFEGGYRATITGSLLSAPLWPSWGRVGVTDYACTWTDDGDEVFEYGEDSCPGYIDWTTQYFSAPTFAYDWWGWVYHGGNNGTWVNSSDGNEGDITD